MTEQRLREMAAEAGLPFPKFLLVAKDALAVDMKSFRLLIIAVCEKADEIGQVEAEALIVAAL